MLTFKTLDSYIISLAILVFMYINAYNRSDKVFIKYKVFISMLHANAAVIIIDLISWSFNGLPGRSSILFNTGLNMLLYILDPLIPVLWNLYINYQVYQDEQRIKKLSRVLAVPFILNAAVTLTSPFTGWFLYVDGSNIYHRGPYSIYHAGICYLLLIYSVIFIAFNRRKLEKRYFLSLLFFILPPMTGSLIQLSYFGISLTWPGFTLSLLITYINIQDRRLSTDYLTGTYNRRQLDIYMKAKIRSSSNEKTFSAMLIDLNSFKSINDRFGHDIGDEALLDVVGIIRKCLRRDDFIARFGGDEFFIIMDIDNREALDQAAERITEAVARFNAESGKPYKISFGMGYDTYLPESKMKPDDFFRHIDMLMYENKKAYHSL